ncbi:MAG: hypothetical protein LBN06_07100 [Prevotellaceae bacterium]|jgi:hypothetical protein|nr:hypothetical protein [Prevotellaceae bacterium]
MNRILLSLKRPFVRLGRIRYRCGYGVHSPFAFSLITHVIYEHTPYYKYEELAKMQRRLAPQKDRYWKYESRKVKQLLFRLVNYAQPATIVDAGTLSASACYLKAAKENADYTATRDLSELFLEAGSPVDFLYVHDYRNPTLVEDIVNLCVARSTERSLFVVEGIGYTPQMRALWQKLLQDDRVGMTFNLYDLGILCFDKRKMKQEYKLCF